MCGCFFLNSDLCQTLHICTHTRARAGLKAVDISHSQCEYAGCPQKKVTLIVQSYGVFQKKRATTISQWKRFHPLYYTRTVCTFFSLLESFPFNQSPLFLGYPVKLPCPSTLTSRQQTLLNHCWRRRWPKFVCYVLRTHGGQEVNKRKKGQLSLPAWLIFNGPGSGACRLPFYV